RVCLLCLNVWRLRGMLEKYNSMKEYMKLANNGSKGQELHRGFLSACAEWLRRHARNPKLKLKDKETLSKSKVTLETVSRQGMRFKKSEKEFVSVEDWNPELELDGPFDQAKVVERMICGEIVKGIFKTVGRKGVYKVEDYEDKAMEERGLEHDGEGLFAEEGLANKKEALAGAFAEAAKVAGLRAPLLQRARLRRRQKSTKKRAKAKANAQHPAAPRASQSSEPAAAGPQEAGGSSGRSSQAFSLDGRGLRLKESLRKQLEDFTAKLAALLAFDDSYDFQDKKKHNSRQKSLQSFKTSLSNQLKRVENSANKAGVTEEVERLMALIKHADAAASLNDCLGQAGPPAEDVKNAVTAVCALQGTHGANVGPNVWKKLLEARCQHHMLYREFKLFAALFEEDCLEVKQLLNVLLRDEVVEFVEREVKFRLTGLLRSIPVQEATKPGSETRLIVKQFCSQISIAGASTKLLERVAKSTEIVHGLMQFENLRELSAAVGNIDALVTRASSCTGEVGDCGAVSAFFEKHTVGAAMLMEAKAKIQASKDAKCSVLAKRSHVVPEHRLEAESLEKEHHCQNSFTGIVEVLNEVWALRNAPVDKAGGQPTARNLSEALSALESPSWLGHGFWKECGGSKMSHDVAKGVEQFASTSAPAAACAHAAFWRRRAQFPIDIAPNPVPASSDSLSLWVDNLQGLMAPFVDDEAQLQLFAANFIADSNEALAAMTLSSFDKVAATQLSAAGAVKWALKLQSSAGKSVRLEAESRALALRSLLEGSERLLGKVPACSQEQDYRHALGKLSQQMAGESVKLKAKAMSSELLSALTACQAAAKGKGDPSLAEPVILEGRPAGEVADRVAQLLVTHVTFFAALTIVRGPHLGGKSEQGKVAARQLQSVALTLLQNELPKTPLHDQLPDDALRSLFVEMANAVRALVKASLGCCSLDVSKSWDAAQAARQKLQQQAPGAARQAKDEQEAAEAAAGPAQSEAAQVAAPALRQEDASAPAKPQEEPQKPPPTGANAEDEDVAKLLGMSEESFLQELELAIVAEDEPVINAEAEEDEEEETKPKAPQEAPCRAKEAPDLEAPSQEAPSQEATRLG
ncbi:unnamed protein product, partial [Effrenium voratum]